MLVSQPSLPTYGPQSIPQKYRSDPSILGISPEIHQPTGAIQGNPIPDLGTLREGWKSGLFDCFQNPSNGNYHTIYISLYICIHIGKKLFNKNI